MSDKKLRKSAGELSTIFGSKINRSVIEALTMEDCMTLEEVCGYTGFSEFQVRKSLVRLVAINKVVCEKGNYRIADQKLKDILRELMDSLE